MGFGLKLLLLFFLIIIVFNIFIYAFDKIIISNVLDVAEKEAKGKVNNIVNNVILKEYSKQFNYDEIIKVEKDNEGNINLLKADTLKMNKIACDVSLDAGEEIRKMGSMGVKIPIGYISKNNILAQYGPKITMKVQPVGYTETKYLSKFESAGINQCRHKIYVQVKTNIRIFLPFRNRDIEVINEVPISETIIVGKVPQTAIQFGEDSNGFKLKN
ncbi:sporulation protein YunB [Clostridium sp. JN-9]|uniref:sporulation protein YunB n=1 Tax=Clostridium sp. JN-9 TaxID=2507159 RepID=UPI000FFE0284|nr:sporulation protein YunB [Clostridium sp. JN-9]QAT39481.1 sporulation protein YunB [Clostridium sp. JN-9]